MIQFQFASLALATLLATAFQSGAPAPAPQQAPAKPEPRVGVRFEGWLPGTHDENLEGEFQVEFRIYLSPQGGDATWSETQTVRVKRGRMDVELGTLQPIPFALHRATFKFLGASVGGAREVYPRFTIVNTVYASPEEALRTLETARATPAESKRADYPAPQVRFDARTEEKRSWEEALRAARESGGDLPDYRDWYADLAKCDKAAVLERSGHYEWVLPWVYDTASHGEYNRLFRGRFQGCDYMDLSPDNAYTFRIARRVEAVPSSDARR
jgi:hypothetical protein